MVVVCSMTRTKTALRKSGVVGVRMPVPLLVKQTPMPHPIPPVPVLAPPVTLHPSVQFHLPNTVTPNPITTTATLSSPTSPYMSPVFPNPPYFPPS